MRRVLTQVMRRLETLGIGTALPDLPGVGESPIDLDRIALMDWRDAVAAAARHIGAGMTASFRGAALLDDASGTAVHWRCAPETGARLVRDLMRTRLAGNGAEDDGQMLSLAGNRVQQSLIDVMAAASPAELPRLRTIRLESDAAPADSRIAGSPMWRRSEPGDDPAFVDALVTDLANWARQCAT